jgi:putative hydrolase of the HAD superfamily
MMKDTVLFDLGNTLVRYFEKAEFDAILRQSIGHVQGYLDAAGLLRVSPEEMWRRVGAENHEAQDGRVRPLEGRLNRIFALEPRPEPEVMEAMCRCFLRPFYSRARRYEDTLPTLAALKAEGFCTAIISNLPWGSPAAPWHKEVVRQGLVPYMSAVVFCTDVGWRKPARPIFEYALEICGAEPQNCLFVGDNPLWDVAGPRALGIEAVLIDRHGCVSAPAEEPIHSLDGLWARLQA